MKNKEDKHKNIEVSLYDSKSPVEEVLTPIVGANQTELYLKLLKGKRIGIVANQTSVIFKTQNHNTHNSKNYTHLVDSLINQNMTITRVFAPEHGFRGQADAGELVKDGVDIRTGLPIISLYGNNKKPTSQQLSDIDIMIFDIQDVGTRFYTYISTLHYIMEACAEHNISLLVLDRPNPNGHYIDGPILEPMHRSFVGMHPVPVVHGMTIGEYAKMINGEGWLKSNLQCKLKIIPVKHYTHETPYTLPIKPSPNLPNAVAVNLYPSLCLFEGTNISVGRGTDKQFQIIGTPFFNLKAFNIEFTPESNLGAKNPKHKNKICHGYDLSNSKPLKRLHLKWLIDMYTSNQKYAPKTPFFTNFFSKLAGTKQLQEKIENGYSETDIRASWQYGLGAYDKMRQPYLIYNN